MKKSNEIRKRLLASGLVLSMLAGMIPASAFAAASPERTEVNDDTADLKYVFEKQLSDDGTSATIKLDITEKEGKTLKEVTLPDGTVVYSQQRDKSDVPGFKVSEKDESTGETVEKNIVNYTATQNGKITFKLKYTSMENVEAPVAETPEVSAPADIQTTPESNEPETVTEPEGEITEPAAEPDTQSTTSEGDTSLIGAVPNTLLPVTEMKAATQQKEVEKETTVEYEVSGIRAAEADSAARAPLNEKAGNALMAKGNVDSLTISNPRLTADTSDGLGKIVKSQSSKGYYARISADSTDGAGTSGVWIAYRFTLKVPDDMEPNWAKFTDVSYNWLLDMDTGTKTSTPTYDAATRTWILEGKYFYNEAQGLGSASAKEYSRSISVTTGLLEQGMTLTPTIETWLPEKSGDMPNSGKGETITVETDPALTTSTEKLTEIVSGLYSPSRQKFYLKKNEAVADGATDTVQGRVYQFKTYTNTETLNPTGNAWIPNRTDVKIHIPLSVTVNGTETATAAEQPILLAAHYNMPGETGKNAYNGTLVNGFDITYGGRVVDYIANFPDVKDVVMSDVSYTGNTINASMSAANTNDSYRGVSAATGYYQVFVPVPATDTEATKRVLKVGSAAVDNVIHSGGAVTETNTPSDVIQIAVERITDETDDFTGVYSRNVRFYYDSATSAAIGSGAAPIGTSVVNVKSEAWAEINAYDTLVKLDADAYKVDTSVSTVTSYWGTQSYSGTRTLRYGVLPGGGNWASDAVMNSTRKADLTFYDAGSVPKGATVVAILIEARGGRLAKGSDNPVLDNVSITDDASKAGSVYQISMDVEIWSGDNTPEKGTFNTAMLATDGSGYKKAYYDADGTYHQDTPNQLNGDSLLLLGYSLTGKAYNLNGTNRPAGDSGDYTSTFDVVKGQRKADIRVEFTINALGTDDPKQEFELQMMIPQYKGNAVLDPDTIRIDANYTSGPTEGAAGVISGGTAPVSVEKATDWDGDYGTYWYRVTFKVRGSGTHNVYASVNLGNALDPDKEVPIGKINYSFVRIEASGSTKNLVTGATNLENNFVITKSNAAGFQKMAVSAGAGSNAEAFYHMVLSAQEQDLNGALLLDILPFNGDGRGTELHGTYSVDKPLAMTLNTPNVTVRTDMGIYYTTDTDIRTLPLKTVSDLSGQSISGDTVTLLGVTWHKAVKTGSDANYSYTVDPGTVAIISSGMVGTNESPMLDIALQMKGMQTGDKLMNTAGFNADEFGKPMESQSASVTVAERKITGKAWIDANNNGRQDAGEAGLAGLTVKLYQGSTEITTNEDGTAYDVTTAADGSYTFGKLPSSPESYHIEFTGGTISDYTVSEKTKDGVAADKNSDVTANPATGTMTSAISDEVNLMTAQQQNDQKQFLDSKQLDGGFVPYWTVNFDTNGGTPAIPEQRLASNDKVTKPTDPTREGYTFGGWYSDTVLTKAWNFDDSVTKDMTLYAKWNKIKTADVTLSGTKTLKEDSADKAIKKAQFSVSITAGMSNDVTGYTGFTAGSKDVGTDGTFAFDKITFKKAGTYTFTISEDDKGAAGYTYDDKAVTVSVDVTFDADNNAWVATPSYMKEGKAVAGITFANTYTTPNPVNVFLEGTKTLSGDKETKDIREDQFSFTLAEAYDNDKTGYTLPANMQEKTVAGGAFAFDKIIFTKAGDYSFMLTEDNLRANGYTYDTKEVRIDVKIALNEKDNTFTKAVIYSEGGTKIDDITFANTYTVGATTVDTPDVEKAFTADSAARPDNKVFAFTLTGKDDAPMPEGSKDGVKTITIAGAGTAAKAFGQIPYTKEGTYTYKIAESKESHAGYSYDTAVYTWVVTVKDVDGELTAAPVLTLADAGTAAVLDKAVFTNSYKVTATDAGAPAVTKAFTTDSAVRPDDKTYTFEMKAVDNAPMPKGAKDGIMTATVTGEGAASAFGSMKYKAAGTYRYTVSEVQGTERGYIYDNNVYTYEVVVKDQDSKLTVASATTYKETGNGKKAQEGKDITFTNAYAAVSDTYTVPTVTKEIDGKTPNDKTFTFTLTGKDNAPMPESSTKGVSTITRVGAGTAEFGEITYTKAGTYTYKVKESAGSDKGYTYDSSVYSIEVAVTDHDGQLKAVGTVTKDGKTAESMRFVNGYTTRPVTVDPPVEKQITGDTPASDEIFTFQMKAKDAAYPMPDGSKDGTKTATIKGAGKVEFGEYTYTKAGTYTYEISEVAGTNREYTYDAVIYTLTDVVTDKEGTLEVARTITRGDGSEAQKAVFNNKYTKAVVPTNAKPGSSGSVGSKIMKTVKTGDTTMPVGLIALLLISGAGSFVLLRRRRRQ